MSNNKAVIDQERLYFEVVVDNVMEKLYKNTVSFLSFGDSSLFLKKLRAEYMTSGLPVPDLNWCRKTPKNVIAWLKERLQGKFLCMDKMPVWVDEPGWLFIDDKPMIFVDQIKLRKTKVMDTYASSGETIYLFAGRKEQEHGWELVIEMTRQDRLFANGIDPNEVEIVRVIEDASTWAPSSGKTEQHSRADYIRHAMENNQASENKEELYFDAAVHEVMQTLYNGKVGFSSFGDSAPFLAKLRADYISSGLPAPDAGWLEQTPENARVWLKEHLKNTFLCMDKMPVWADKPDWLFINDQPMVFIAQVKLLKNDVMETYASSGETIYLFAGRKKDEDGWWELITETIIQGGSVAKDPRASKDS